MKTNRGILLVGVLLGLIAVFLLNSYIQDIKDEEGVVVEVVYKDVLVADVTIPRNTLIEEGMFSPVSVAEDAVHPQAVLSSDNIIGSYAKYDIVKGEQLLFDKLITDITYTKLSNNLKEGMRAITLSVNEIVGVGNYVVAGDKVDILTIYNVENTEEPKTIFTQLENIEILKVGPNMGPVVNDEMESYSPTSVTVSVTPAQAEVIALANLNGTFQLTLRNSDDDGENEKVFYNE